MKATVAKSGLLILVAAVVGAYFAFDLNNWLSLELLKSRHNDFQNYYHSNKVLTLSVFFAVYVAVTSLSLPGAALLTLSAGALFGLWTGTLIASFASSIGATFAFLIARFLFRDSIQNRFQDKLRVLNEGVRKEGAYYLFSLRLIPIFPFFVINAVLALTPLRTVTFYWVSQFGMLPGTVVYVNAGTQIAQIDSLKGILSPSLIASFALLGLFPILSKKGLAMVTSRKNRKRYKKPARFDYNMIVIGAGSAGLVSAYIAATVKAKVALIERHQMGGDCLNTGCVPSKALIRTAKFLAEARNSSQLGVRRADIVFDFAEAMERVQSIIKKIEPHDSVERYTGLGVECIKGSAFLKSPYEVAVNGKSLTTKSIVVATGASPLVPDIDGLRDMRPLTSENIWDLREKPDRLLVLGGGPIGCELAQTFQRLGCQVTLAERGPRLLQREDEDVSTFVLEKFQDDGVDVRLGHEAIRFRREGNQNLCYLRRLDSSLKTEIAIPFDRVLVALGRKANTRGFGLEELGIVINPNGTVATDAYLRTTYPNIYACGDVAGPFQFTHTASHQAWYCAVNALFSPLKKFKADYRVIPWATYTDPEVARVGLNEVEAREAGIRYEVTRYSIDDLDRAITDSADHGMIKVLTVPGKDRILGVTIAGPHAGDIIAEFVTAMKYGIGLNKILGTIHIYPTFAEANKYAAGAWKRARAPQKLLRYLQKFHAWRRS